MVTSQFAMPFIVPPSVTPVPYGVILGVPVAELAAWFLVGVVAGLLLCTGRHWVSAHARRERLIGEPDCVASGLDEAA